MHKRTVSLLAVIILMISAVSILLTGDVHGAVPSFGTDYSDTTATTGDTFNFVVNCTDADDDITSVTVYYKFGTGSYSSLTMTAGSGGNYSESITIPSDSTDTLYYYFEADDALNTTRDPSTGDRSVIVTDNDDPIFGSDSSDTSATTGDSFDFGIAVTDNVDTTPSVSVEYWFGSGSHTTTNMTGTGPYIHQITIPSDSTSTLHYIFHAADDGSNTNQTTQVDISVIDNDKPTILIDNSDTTASTGEPFIIKITSADNIGVTGFSVKHWCVEGFTTNSTPLLANPHVLTINIPSDAEVFHYIVYIRDLKGNFADISQVDISVTDNDKPEFGIDNSGDIATTGDSFLFSIRITDNVNLTSKQVEYWFGSGTHTTVDMSGPNTYGYYTYQITIPDDSTETLHYIFHAADNSSNTAKTAQYDLTVTDDDNPVFGAETTDSSATTGDPFNFNIQVSDNVGVFDVYVEYWFGTGSHTNASMSGTGLFTKKITIPSGSTDTLHYILSASDAGNNWINNAEKTVLVSDNDKPTFQNNKTSPSTLTTGDPISVSIEIDDNIKVNNATLYYDFGTGSGYQTSTTYTISLTTYKWSLTVPDGSKSISYYFKSYDTSSNYNISSVFGTAIFDNDQPTFRKNILDPDPPTTGDPLIISVEINDNIKVMNAILHYDFGTGEISTSSYVRTGSVFNWSVIVPYNATHLDYYFTATDSAINTGISDTWADIPIYDNDKPTFSNNIITPSNLRTGDTFSISVDISDNIRVTGATLYYDFGSGYVSSTTYSVNGSIYEWDFLTVDSGATSMDYYVTAVDGASNMGTSSVWTTPVSDDDAPTFTGITLDPAEPTTGDTLNISADIRDNIGVVSATLHYKFGNGYSTITTNVSVGSIYTWSIQTPIDATSFTYYFSADDGSFGGESIDRTVGVVDNDDPVFSDCIITSTTLETGESMTISVEITDNIRVDNTVLNYNFGSGYDTSSSYTISEAKYSWSLDIPIDSTSFIFYFSAEDLQGNENETGECSVNITDSIKPNFVDTSKSSASSGDPYTLDITASDNIGIKWVNLTWSHGDLGGKNIALDDDGDGTWSITITLDHSTDPLTYTVTFIDTSGNSIKSTIQTITVIDNDDPDFTDKSPEAGYSGDDYIVEVEASDNIGIKDIHLTWSHGSLGGSDLIMTSMGDGTWRITLHLDQSTDKLSYTISVEDISGNTLNGTEMTVSVADNDLPTIKDLDDVTIYSGNPFSLSVEAGDNVGINEIKWSGLPKTFYGSTIEGYVNQSGTYTVTITVSDDSGNTNQITITVTVLSKSNDIDEDGIPDLIEETYGLNSYDPNDAVEDMDGDDLSNLDEYLNGTLINIADSDGDGMPDGWEVQYGLDPVTTNNSDLDTDGDGVTDLQEYLDGTDPSVDESNELYTYVVWIILLVLVIFALIGALTVFLIIRKGKRPIQLLKAEFTGGTKEVFISYAHDDQNVAYAICNRMEEKGLNCWIAPRDVTPGMNWGKSIIEAINLSKVMILVFSSKSNESEQVLREVERAVNKKVPIIMYRITDIMPSQELEYFISAVHWLDAFTEPADEHLDNLASTVESTLNPEKAAETQKLKEGQQRPLLKP